MAKGFQDLADLPQNKNLIIVLMPGFWLKLIKRNSGCFKEGPYPDFFRF
jgi:hypothetical protein